jgi:hypothetical protein
LLKRLPTWFYIFLSAVAITIALLQSYPWLSLEEGIPLDPQNPFTTLFDVSNSGYIPLTDLEAACQITVETDRHSNAHNFSIRFPEFSSYLSHGDSRTIPCFQAVARTPPTTPGALAVAGNITMSDINVIIAYSFYHINWKRLRRHQSFHLYGMKDTAGIFHWIRID